MKRLSVIAVLLLLASAASAVEVFVKTETKLYSDNGKVLRTVTAGYPFQADRSRGKWAYGLIQSKGGGARGWILVEALDLDDEARRALHLPITTGKSAEPVLLRYRLAPGGLEVYESSGALRLNVAGEDEGQAVAAKGTLKYGFTLSYKGKSRAEDGLIKAALSFHDFWAGGDFDLDFQNRSQPVAIRVDRQGIRVSSADRPLWSGTWGAGELKKAPLDKVFNVPLDLTLNDRGELLVLGPPPLADPAEGFQAIDFREIFSARGKAQGPGLQELFGGFVFPDEPVRGGDSWVVEADVSKADLGEDALESLPGLSKEPYRTTYTLLERGAYAERPCAKIRIISTGPQAQWLRWSTDGIAYVDEATGIRLSTTYTVSVHAQGVPGAGNTTISISGTFTIRYLGNKLK